MAKYVIEDTTLTNTANAIREKTGKTDTITPSNFATEIAGIQSGGGDTSIEDGLIDGTITEYSNDRITSIREYAFYYMGLEFVNFPNVTIVGERGFMYCISLKEAIMPNVITLKQRAFDGCSLTSIDFPNLTNVEKTAFQSNAFELVRLPNVVELFESTFNGCKKLKKAFFPKVTSIAQNCFYLCEQLEALVLNSETMCTLTNKSAFTATPIASGTGYIYVPSALIEEYKAATNWVTYANQFRAIEDYPEICGEVA